MYMLNQAWNLAELHCIYTSIRSELLSLKFSPIAVFYFGWICKFTVYWCCSTREINKFPSMWHQLCSQSFCYYYYFFLSTTTLQKYSYSLNVCHLVTLQPQTSIYFVEVVWNRPTNSSIIVKLKRKYIIWRVWRAFVFNPPPVSSIAKWNLMKRTAYRNQLRSKYSPCICSLI